MKILALDTAQGACSVAVWKDGEVLARRFERMRVGHAEQLVPMAMEAMATAGLEMTELDRLACTIGPGTFTGTRVALSAARGMALALKAPLVGVTTLEAVACGIAQAPDSVRATCFDAKRGELYCQVFGGDSNDDALAALTEPLALSYEATAEAAQAAAAGKTILIAGTGAALLAEALAKIGTIAECPNVEPHPDAALVAMIASGRPAPDTVPSPLYLRAPDAKLPDPK